MKDISNIASRKKHKKCDFGVGKYFLNRTQKTVIHTHNRVCIEGWDTECRMVTYLFYVDISDCSPVSWVILSVRA